MNNKRIVILGAGESGVGSAILAKSKGYEVFVSDNGNISKKYKDDLINNNIDWEEGGHSENFILNAGLIIKSPGIPESVPIIKKIIEKKIRIISEIEFAGVYTNAKKICITGSNGKTTTTLMIYHLLKKAGLNVGVAGNVGKSFALQVARNSFDYYVIELSSFQLDGMYEFKPDIAIIMNITPDHLNRYDNVFQNYVNSKFRITQNLTTNDYLIYCSDDELVKNEITKRNINTNKLPFSLSNERNNGAYVEQNNIIINMTNNNFIMSIQDLALQGKHNTYNSMAAGLTGKVLKIRKEVIRESLADFQGVEHRLEPVIKVHGIEFINDSKATNVNSTWYALETMSKPIVWVVGGIDKGNDYSILNDLVRDKVKAIVCLGKDNEKIHKAFADYTETIIDTSSIEEAVSAAYYLAEKGEVVLLSPACASFDLFENYEDRGRRFKNAVRDL
ncbi:MAG: UDP-N-acetylmuramoyl-L-alanine--D-glutamate ligase [Bacteroidetes bacterium]|nr:MAG: UDP-N-acetylmuramoyl-L-alanine--D-glutamate ligase [Bacteroidota bacterium]